MRSVRQMCIAAIAAFALLTTPIAFLGQQPASTPGSDSPGQQTENTIRVPDGTVVRLLVTDAISGKTAKKDSEVHVRVIDEVKAGDLVVIANRAPASAHIATLQRARRSLRKGEMAIKLDSVALVTGQTQKLRGLSFSKGGDFSGKGTDADVDPYMLLLALPFLPFAHGEEAYLPKGTVLSAALDGDALLDRTSVLAGQPPHSPKEGPASVTFYWLYAQRSRDSRVLCGTVKLGDLYQGHNFTVHLPPGNYWFRLHDKKKAIRIALAPGEDYFLRLSPFSGNHLEAVEHDIGEVEVTETHPIAKKKIVDVSTASLSDLQADPRNR